MKATFQAVLDRWIGQRSYEDVAPLLGAAISTVHSWRHGSTLPPATRLPALAAAMRVPEGKLRQIVDRERAERKHPSDRAPSVTTATVDESRANEVVQ